MRIPKRGRSVGGLQNPCIQAMSVGEHVRHASSHECADGIRARCVEIAGTRAAAHVLHKAAEPLVAWMLQHAAEDCSSWSALLRERIRATWELQPRALVWLDDKLEQVPRTMELCQMSGVANDGFYPVIAEIVLGE